ncbi:MAG: MBL fold metallo-hydrolase [Eubacteriales bacterium]|nr:MBL fold metallo-hydrolase [Eubacteriales bacterium]
MRICPLCSGSSGNSTYVETSQTRLLIDAGLSCRKLTALLDSIGVRPDALSAICITHEHVDHVRGAAVLSRKYNIPIFANAACHQAMYTVLADVPRSNIRVFESDEPFVLGNATIVPFSTPHDSAHAVGYTISDGRGCITIMTDIGHMDDRLLSMAEHSSVVLLEANHDVDMLMAGSYPYSLKMRILSPIGHLCNEDCAHAIAELARRGVKNVVLGHLSRENNFPEIALATVNSVLEIEGQKDSVTVTVAKREEPTGYFETA